MLRLDTQREMIMSWLAITESQKLNEMIHRPACLGPLSTEPDRRGVSESGECNVIIRTSYIHTVRGTVEVALKIVGSFMI